MTGTETGTLTNARATAPARLAATREGWTASSVGAMTDAMDGMVLGTGILRLQGHQYERLQTLRKMMLNQTKGSMAILDLRCLSQPVQSTLIDATRR